jgi:hypothetical protein
MMGRAQIMFIIKVLLFVQVIAGLAVAQDMRGLNQKKAELELEKEMEDLEKYGEAANQAEVERETARLTRETKQLEREIQRTRQSNERAVQKAKRLAGLYQRKARLANAVQAQARSAERRRLAAEKVVNRLDSKVKIKEAEAIQAVQRRKDAEADYAQLLQDQKVLERRLKAAQATIKINDQKRRDLRAKSLTLSRSNQRLKQKVVQVENHAARL